MSRPLRIEFPGATYHVTARGNRRAEIFVDVDDRRRMLEILGQAMARHDAQVFAYCLMGNHYHLVLRTRRANLSRIMRHLNGEYARTFNQRHSLVGHLFQRRFHSVLVDTDAYLLEVCRYVELNPVRARLVDRVAEWDWSSFRANTGRVAALPWLAVGDLHGHMLQRDVIDAGDRLAAAQAYERHVHEGLSANPWKDGLRGEIFLGDDAFVARMQACSAIPAAECPEIPLCQRRDTVDRRQRQALAAARAEAFRTAYVEQGMTMSQIAGQANLSVSRISRLIARAEKMAR
jgi:REP element-mobilizing transposase RayT